MQIYPLLSRGVFATFGYFVGDDASGHALLIDPGAQPDLFLQAIREGDWTVEAILLTHGHFDHFGAAGVLRDELGVPVMAHGLSERYLLDSQLNLSAQHGLDITLPRTVKFAEGDRLALGANPSVELEVLHVPGHTDDSCVFYCEVAGAAFVGDTVYEGGPGLTVFPTGDARKLREGIEGKLLRLPPQTVLLSGHSRPMTVEQLRRVVVR